MVQKTGYLYVYVSNESNMDVFFDDLVINHKTGPLLQVNNYRAFGSDIASQNARAFTATENKYKYNGKELQSKEWSDGSGLEQYDYGARHYDACVGRWMVVDPLGEKGRRWSVYTYAFNNPLRFVDPDGIWATQRQKNDAERFMENSEASENENYQVLSAVKAVVRSFMSGENRKYLTRDEAALAWSIQYSETGLKHNVEYGSSIYSFKEKGNIYYSYNKAAEGETIEGGTQQVEWNQNIPTGAVLEGVIHSHTGSGKDPNNFSTNPSGFTPKKGDVELMNDQTKDYSKVNWYLATPDGHLKVAYANGRGGHTVGIPIAGGLPTQEQVNLLKNAGLSLPIIVPDIYDNFDYNKVNWGIGKPLPSPPSLTPQSPRVIKPFELNF
jgi:RHS repeat-associated protein